MISHHFSIFISRLYAVPYKQCRRKASSFPGAFIGVSVRSAGRDNSGHLKGKLCRQKPQKLRDWQELTNENFELSFMKDPLQ